MTSFLIRKDPHLSVRYLSLTSQLPAALRTSTPKIRVRFFWARNAIYHGLRFLGIPAGSKVLLPAYLCKAAVQPIAAYGAEPVFYAVHRDCAPDLADLESRIDSRTRMVMAVHYFGFPHCMRELRALCDRYGLLLLEDCAHVLEVDPVERPLGTLGDASVFSWRKFLPLYDGGELLLNRRTQESAGDISWQPESLLFTLKAIKNLLEEIAPARVSEGRIEEETLSKDGTLESRAGSNETSPLRVDRNGSAFVMGHANFPMSRVSRFFFPHFSLAKIGSKRRDNYLYLQARLSVIGGVRSLHEELTPGVVPWMFPVFIGESPNMHRSLRELGIPAVSWGGVRHARFSSRDFPNADFLYENLVFLPIHQDLGEKEMNLIVEAVEKARRSARSTVSISRPAEA